MTTDPTQAPVVAAYVRDAAGNYYRINSVGISQTDADTRYVNITGDTMTGMLAFSGQYQGVRFVDEDIRFIPYDGTLHVTDNAWNAYKTLTVREPTSVSEVATKQYVDSRTANFVQLKLAANVSSPGSGVVYCPLNTTDMAQGSAMTVSGGYINIITAGNYHVGGLASMNFVTGVEAGAFITVWRSGAQYLNINIIDAIFSSSIFCRTGGSEFVTLQAGDQLRYAAYGAGAGHSLNMPSLMWARKF